MSTALMAGADIQATIDYDKLDMEKAKEIVKQVEVAQPIVEDVATKTNAPIVPLVEDDEASPMYFYAMSGASTRNGFQDTCINNTLGFGYQPFDSVPVAIEADASLINSSSVIVGAGLRANIGTDMLPNWLATFRAGVDLLKTESVESEKGFDLSGGVLYKYDENNNVGLNYVKYFDGLDGIEKVQLAIFHRI